jgi:transcriptional regulator with XRE-family HTH domain
MITAIRQVRKAKGLTLADVGARCVPPTTAQTIGRLETGTRTVSVGWLNRIAKALDVEAGDLVKLPEQQSLPVAAIMSSDGVSAPRHEQSIAPLRPAPEGLAIIVDGSIGDYRAGDQIWCDRVAPDDFGNAINRDVLIPRPAGRFIFGRMLARENNRLLILPLAAGAKQQVFDDPAWLGIARRIVREL